MAQRPKNNSSQVTQNVCSNCIGLKAAFEALQSGSQTELTYLRQMVKDLTDKLMCLTPEMADRHHRLKLTELAQVRPEVMSGIVPMHDSIPGEDDTGFNQWFDNFSPGAKTGAKK